MNDTNSPARTANVAPDVTRKLARFVVETRPENIPDTVRHEARRALLNWLGCAIGGARHPAVDAALAALAQFSGAPDASVLGRSERLDILHAALMNGISSHVLDFDDTQHPTLIHPSGPVIPAALALAEKERLPGEALIHSIVLGIDIACRVGRAVFPAHYRAGWHITGTAGVFGAAAAAGALLRLSEQQMTWALGLAATQASGLREMFGTMSKSLHPGRAAQNGLAAAFLARAGFTSSERGIEAPAGFAHVLSSEQDFSQALDDLGKRFELMTNTYKPYACGLVIHPVIDGCLALRAQHRRRRTASKASSASSTRPRSPSSRARPARRNTPTAWCAIPPSSRCATRSRPRSCRTCARRRPSCASSSPTGACSRRRSPTRPAAWSAP